MYIVDEPFQFYQNHVQKNCMHGVRQKSELVSLAFVFSETMEHIEEKNEEMPLNIQSRYR